MIGTIKNKLDSKYVLKKLKTCLQAASIVVLLLSFSIAALANDITVKGTVTSLDGDPLAGASVKAQGGSGTSTDASGNYSITVKENATLVFSYVGYASQTINVAGRTVINVTLVSETKLEEQVIVIGYGTQRKIDNTGSVANVRGEDIAKQANNNPIASLQGRVAGVTIVNSGAAGATPTVRIRGVNSTSGSAGPLYVVDGIFQDNINYLNPNDIESIDVLKDPASIAIFGLSGGNGVIAVTTKKAAKGKTRISFQTNTGISKVHNLIKVTDAAGFKKLYDQQLSNLNAPAFDYTNYTADVDYQDLVLRTGFFTNNNITVSNATEKGSTIFSAGYNKEKGVLRNDEFQRLILRLNQQVSINKNLKIGGEITGYFSDRNPASASIINALRIAPITPVKAGEGLYYSTPSFQRAQVGNPIATLDRNDNTSINRSYRAVASVFAELKFARNFTFKSQFYADYLSTNGRNYTPLPFRVINLGEGTTPTDTTFNIRQRTAVSQSISEDRKFQQDHFLTYAKKFNNVHDLTLLAGVTTLYKDGSNVNGNRTDTTLNIPNDPSYYYINIVGQENPGTFGGGGDQSAQLGYFTRANYSYMNRYLVNASFRRDGNSKLSPENRYQNYASVGLGWIVSKESFWNNVKGLDYLKLRASYGSVGNGLGLADNLFRPIATQTGIGVFGENIYPSIGTNVIVSEGLRAEIVVGKDFAIEWRALKNKLSGEITLYDRTTKNIIVTQTVPITGQTLRTNAGNISNKGVELTLGWNDRIGKDFTYGISANGSYNKNNVESIGDGFDFVLTGNGGANRTVTGNSIGYFYGYRQVGIYQSTADLVKQPAFVNSLPGDIAYEDVNGDGVITPADRTFLGSPLPKYNFGGEVAVGYKNFDASIAFNGVAGNKIYTQRRINTFAQTNYEVNRLNAYTGPGTSNIEPILDLTRGNNYLFSSYYLEKGDYFRIRNLQIGYNFANNIAKSLRAQTLRISLSAQNLATFSYATGYTPEVGIGSVLGGGADNGTYPVPTVYTFGVNVVF